MKKFPRAAALCLVVSTAACAPSRGSSLRDDAVATWPTSHPATITIVGPFDEFIYSRHEALFDPEQKQYEAEYRNATIRSGEQSLNAKIRLRGGVRFCDGFPHFTLKMKGDDQLFGRDKYKLVSHGSYAHDPQRAVDAPACGNELATRTAGSSYVGEYQVYKVAEKILGFYLETVAVDVTYREASSGAEVSGFGFLIEDMADAGRRYQATEREFERLHESLSWRRADDESLYEALLGDAFFNHMAGIYRRLEAEHPNLSEKEISARLPSFATLQGTPEFEAMKASAQAGVPSLRTELPQVQQDFLASMDRQAMIHGALFNILIGNTDWALFGLNNHSSGTRNFKFLVAQGVTYPVAYDFDLSTIAEGRAVALADYQSRLMALRESVTTIFGSPDQIDYASHQATFAERVREFLAAQPQLPEHIRSSFTLFLQAGQ